VQPTTRGPLGLFVLGVLLGRLMACGSVRDGVVWDDETTWTCSGSDERTIEGVTKAFTTPDLIAVEAGGDCQLHLVNCDISADFPVKAYGNAVVTITGGHIRGGKQSLQAMGGSKIVVDGATIEGPEPGTMGNATIEGL
jgi:hypothetical protein